MPLQTFLQDKKKRDAHGLRGLEAAHPVTPALLSAADPASAYDPSLKAPEGDPRASGSPDMPYDVQHLALGKICAAGRGCMGGVDRS